MQCGTAHVSAVWHTVCGTVLLVFLVPSTLCQQIFCIAENKECLSIFCVMLEHRGLKSM
jgi:hypothetical protein